MEFGGAQSALNQSFKEAAALPTTKTYIPTEIRLLFWSFKDYHLRTCRAFVDGGVWMIRWTLQFMSSGMQWSLKGERTGIEGFRVTFFLKGRLLTQFQEADGWV